jgi:hypothetical protein
MTTSARTKLRRILSLDPYVAQFAELRSHVEQLELAGKLELLALCRSCLADPASRAVEVNRVCAVKMLIALLPDSWTEIEAWLGNQTLEDAYEVHFSIFCFLDDVAETPSLVSFRPRVTRLAEEYLTTVQSDDAFAAWMAGDFLGDHWPSEAALPPLLYLSRSAIHPAGRKGAIHGLSHFLGRVETGPSEKNRIVTLLRKTSKEDVDRSVRRYAKLVLAEYAVV